MIYANAAATYCILNEDECQIDGWGWLVLVAIIVVSVAIIWWCED
jgi:hypothetical protein